MIAAPSLRIVVKPASFSHIRSTRVGTGHVKNVNELPVLLEGLSITASFHTSSSELEDFSSFSIFKKHHFSNFSVIMSRLISEKDFLNP